MKWILMIFLLGFGFPLSIKLEDPDFIKKCKLLDLNMKKIRVIRYIEINLLWWVLPFGYLSCIGVGLGYYRHIFSVNAKFNSFKRNLNLQFSIWLRMMEVLLAYNTVVVAIGKSIDKAPLLMKTHLESLYEALLEDPNNQDAYFGFMGYMDDLNIGRAMHHLYRYGTLGTEDASTQLSGLIQDNAEHLKTHRKQQFEDRLNFYSWYGLLPMLLVSATFLALMFLVLSNLMEGGWQV